MDDFLRIDELDFATQKLVEVAQERDWTVESFSTEDMMALRISRRNLDGSSFVRMAKGKTCAELADFLIKQWNDFDMEREISREMNLDIEMEKLLPYINDYDGIYERIMNGWRQVIKEEPYHPNMKFSEVVPRIDCDKQYIEGDDYVFKIDGKLLGIEYRIGKDLDILRADWAYRDEIKKINLNKEVLQKRLGLDISKIPYKRDIRNVYYNMKQCDKEFAFLVKDISERKLFREATYTKNKSQGWLYR